MANILVVDDEIGIRELLSEILNDEGHTVLLAENAQQARQVRANETLDLVLLDIWMPDTDGVTLLKEWAANSLLTMPVIMMSGHATIDTAVQATRIGAMDFLEKPIALQKLLKAVQAGLNRNKPAPLSTVLGSGLTLAASNPSHHAPTISQMMASPAPAAAPTVDSSHTVTQLVTNLVQVGSQNVPLDQPLREARDEFERVYFEYHLARENYSMTRVAERTGLERTHLYRKLKQLGIELGKSARRAQNAA
ncbi:response regulator [Parvibium lacunae]|uniref:Response regulator n=1 Tax=Parvibium lacunae TaxID=1888893 RepID=A0A368KZX2_9BURK|nr:response regulator [Parvibium lacunae]RCS56855.1 response regulator [Parvibium lacunae]